MPGQESFVTVSPTVPSLLVSAINSHTPDPMAARTEVVSSPLQEQSSETSAIAPVLGTQPSTPLSWRGELNIFSSTFLTIFLAELGDKTQLTTLLMSAESQNPWVVFAGAGAALVLTSLLGVLLGRWLATKVSPKTLEISAGVLLLFISTLLVLDILKT